MKQLFTIQKVHKIFETGGSSPLLVTCNDFNEWVCKYDRFPNYLFNELIASEFAKVWNINVPETSLITVDKQHIPFEEYPTLHPRYFDKECFGSLQIKESIDVDLSSVSLFRQKGFINKITDKEDFLKIALFDIWLANEDRSHNNFNLLIKIDEDKMKFFFAIDHVNIFNTSSAMDYGITALTEDETIINTEIAILLFGKTRALPLIVDSLVEMMYLCITNCENKIGEIFDLVPDSWLIDKEDYKEKIAANIFSESWKKNCERHFRSFIQSFLIKK